MDETDLLMILPTKMYETIERAGINTVKQILMLSLWDIKKLTNMNSADIKMLKSIVADHASPDCVTCGQLEVQEQEKPRVTTGCTEIDSALRGGFRRGALSEVYGESGSGKTQLALQAAVHNWPEGCIYICTEDMFPVKRFEQIKQALPDYNQYVDYGKNIFIEHVTEATDLNSCIRVRLPKLLQNKSNHPSLVIIDSIAAPYRTEYSNYIQRAEQLRELACSLISLAQKHNLAVLCINQVTGSFNGDNEVVPSLGLAWSNMISTRLCIRKTPKTVQVDNRNENNVIKTDRVHLREFSVIFAPDLPDSKLEFVITASGIQCI